jgi:hypothetical protein
MVVCVDADQPRLMVGQGEELTTLFSSAGLVLRPGSAIQVLRAAGLRPGRENIECSSERLSLLDDHPLGSPDQFRKRFSWGGRTNGHDPVLQPAERGKGSAIVQLWDMRGTLQSPQSLRMARSGIVANSEP